MSKDNKPNASTIVGDYKHGWSTDVENVFDTGKGLKNAAAIAEGKDFGKEELKKAKERGLDVAGEVRLVLQNGEGNVKGNITIADQLIKNEDGTYTIVETKLRSTTDYTKNQKKAKNHVNNGNKYFEIRSDVDELGLKKGDVIIVTDYQRLNKHNN
jgi:hypothetical protein